MDNKDDQAKNRKIQEPFEPENTPEPAQVKDPNRQGPKAEEGRSDATRNPGKQEEEKPETSKKLGESETEINDETTI
ncbi:MAG TPA: hypothetical protein VEB86_17260 [Chryseosolibacter sp.]|nr:hypothetical protein [Chryseosolibacter sp.]